MLCERCSKKKATVFYNENINGKTRAFHLCGDCAANMQKSGELEDLSSAFAHFASPLMALEEGFAGELFALPFTSAPSPTASKKCPLCGATLGNIIATGKAGCATCYKTFAPELEPTLRATHGKAAYAGRTPRGFRAKQERAARVAALRQKLKEAVSQENYEEAASLRDRIRTMEAEA